jgi:hypothetical protein
MPPLESDGGEAEKDEGDDHDVGYDDEHQCVVADGPPLPKHISNPRKGGK